MKWPPRPHQLIIAGGLVLTCLAAGLVLVGRNIGPAPANQSPAQVTVPQPAAPPRHPLDGRRLYVDNSRIVTQTQADYQRKGRTEEAQLLSRIADQPAAIWLNGPTPENPTAADNIDRVVRTSTEAAAQAATPVYQLYAIPLRDACAAHSKGGFSTAAEYLDWIDRILANIKTPAVFTVEADAVAHSINQRCLNSVQINERYATLNSAMQKLSQSPMVLAAYLDAGHAEWFPNPIELVEPLRRAGVEHGRGIAANVSNYIDTAITVNWAQQLVQQIGGGKGVVIDTSRNGQGAPDASVTGDARWCNPAGRGIGPRPNTSIDHQSIDAYLWIKGVGESDGNCGGYPSAGTFVPELAISLVRNASE